MSDSPRTDECPEEDLFALVRNLERDLVAIVSNDRFAREHVALCDELATAKEKDWQWDRLYAEQSDQLAAARDKDEQWDMEYAKLSDKLAAVERENRELKEGWRQAKMATEAIMIERCAKVCERKADAYFDEHGTTEYDVNARYYRNNEHEAYDEGLRDAADAIRALNRTAAAQEPRQQQDGQMAGHTSPSPAAAPYTSGLVDEWQKWCDHCREIAAAQEAKRQSLGEDDVPSEQPAAAAAHTDHPARHWDRTCPACNPEKLDWTQMSVSELAAGNPSLRAYSDTLEHRLINRTKELEAMRILAANPLSIQKVKNALGPLSLWSESGMKTHDGAMILQGMEEAAKLFDGYTFGPYAHPAGTIRAEIARRKAG